MIKMIEQTVNSLMDELENEIKYMMVAGEPTPLRVVIDRILSEDNEKKRRISAG